MVSLEMVASGFMEVKKRSLGKVISGRVCTEVQGWGINFPKSWYDRELSLLSRFSSLGVAGREFLASDFEVYFRSWRNAFFYVNGGYLRTQYGGPVHGVPVRGVARKRETRAVGLDEDWDGGAVGGMGRGGRPLDEDWCEGGVRGRSGLAVETWGGYGKGFR